MLSVNPFILAAIFASGLMLGGLAANNHWQSKLDRLERKAAQAQLELVNNAIERHNKQIIEMERQNNDTENKLNDAKLALARANDASDSLQQSISDNVRRASKACDSSATTAERAAAATNTIVLANVLRRADKRAGELAEIADNARIRGLACEAAYKTLK